MANKGYFIITDISGYTEYLTRSELDHANEILQALFDAQLKGVRHPFALSGFRGAHSDLQVYSKILDWKPFDYYTMEQSVMRLNYRSTRRLTSTENGTRVGIYLSQPKENSSNEVKLMLQSAMGDGYAGLKPYIEQDIINGNVTA